MHKRILLSFLLLPALILPTQAVLHAQEDGNTEQSFEAVVEGATRIPCQSSSEEECLLLSLRGKTGAFKGTTFNSTIEPNDTLQGVLPSYRSGDRVIVQTQIVNGERRFFVSDVIRRSALTWLLVVFVAGVLVTGGFRGLRSFLGLTSTLPVLFFLIIPGILAGWPPVTVTIAGSLLAMLATFLISHGWNRKTFAALVGTTVSLLFTGTLAYFFAGMTKITGLADEEMMFLMSDAPSLNARGIVLSGIIIGALGILDDITIAQSSAVFELRKANPSLGIRPLFRSATRIGVDHIAAAVNTLVLAYAGTSLPLLLLLVGMPAGESFWTMINREMIATEIVRALVGSLGLLAAVPLTTFFASLLAFAQPHPRLTR